MTPPGGVPPRESLPQPQRWRGQAAVHLRHHQPRHARRGTPPPHPSNHPRRLPDEPRSHTHSAPHPREPVRSRATCRSRFFAFSEAGPDFGRDPVLAPPPPASLLQVNDANGAPPKPNPLSEPSPPIGVPPAPRLSGGAHALGFAGPPQGAPPAPHPGSSPQQFAFNMQAAAAAAAAAQMAKGPPHGMPPMGMPGFGGMMPPGGMGGFGGMGMGSPSPGSPFGGPPAAPRQSCSSARAAPFASSTPTARRRSRATTRSDVEEKPKPKEESKPEGSTPRQARRRWQARSDAPARHRGGGGGGATGWLRCAPAGLSSTVPHPRASSAGRRATRECPRAR